MFQPKHLLALASFTLFTTLPLAAQREPPMRPAPQKPRQVIEQPQGQREGRPLAKGGDAVLATWLQVESNHEVALARVALGKTENAEVKAFAQQIVVDREAFLKALRPFLDTEVTEVTDGNGDAKSKPVQPRNSSGVREATPMEQFDHTALIRDLGLMRQETAIKMLDAKTGIAFDQCFLRMQVAGHQDATGALQVFRSYASEQLTPVLDRGDKIAAEHLELAEALCKKVDPAPKGEVGGSAAPK